MFETKIYVNFTKSVFLYRNKISILTFFMCKLTTKITFL